jgi:hypothetical protein
VISETSVQISQVNVLLKHCRQYEDLSREIQETETANRSLGKQLGKFSIFKKFIIISNYFFLRNAGGQPLDRGAGQGD